MASLVITANRLGDAVLSTGVIDHLITTGRGPLTVACGPVPTSLFEGVPGIARVITVHKLSWSRHWLTLWARTVQQPWDTVVDLRGSALAWVLRARHRRVWRAGSGHRVAEMARVIGVTPPPAPRVTPLPITPPATPLLGLGPTANFRGKQWPTDRFIAVARALLAGPLAGAKVAVFAAPSERAQAAAVLSAFPDALDLIDTGNLRLVAGWLAACRLFIGNDSGLMHLAAAAGAPTLGLFGPSPDALYRPWGDHTSFVRTPEPSEALWQRRKAEPRFEGHMMDSLTVAAAHAAAIDLLARTG
ncbi:MAG: glycosyltransferase family 9 protein [Alphaproteobacteria bacterium]|nr:glycosyltransferase family 9 protein [Alphaproteobacteria bacterium]